MDKYAILHLASSQGDTEMVKSLLDKGADVNTTNEFGETALHLASSCGHTEIVKLFLDKGVDFNIISKFRETALDFALWNEYTVIIRMLLAKAADVSHIRKHLLKYVIAIKVLDSNINAAEFPYFPNEYDRLRTECESEILLLKSEKIGTSSISFHDILIKSMNQLVDYARNKSIVEALDSDDYKIRFSIYGKMIYDRFKYAMTRRELLNQGFKAIYPIFIHKLNKYCVEEICTYLNNDDLKMYADKK